MLNSNPFQDVGFLLTFMGNGYFCQDKIQEQSAKKLGG